MQYCIVFKYQSSLVFYCDFLVSIQMRQCNGDLTRLITFFEILFVANYLLRYIFWERILFMQIMQYQQPVFSKQDNKDIFGKTIANGCFIHLISKQTIMTIGSHSPSNINPAVNLLQLSLKKNQIARYPYETPNINAGTKRINIPVAKQ